MIFEQVRDKSFVLLHTLVKGCLYLSVKRGVLCLYCLLFHVPYRIVIQSNAYLLIFLNEKVFTSKTMIKHDVSRVSAMILTNGDRFQLNSLQCWK